MDNSLQEQYNRLVDVKRQMVAEIIAKGGYSSYSHTFNEIADDIKTIKYEYDLGYHYYVSTAKTDSEFSVDDAKFKILPHEVDSSKIEIYDKGNAKTIITIDGNDYEVATEYAINAPANYIALCKCYGYLPDYWENDRIENCLNNGYNQYIWCKLGNDVYALNNGSIIAPGYDFTMYSGSGESINNIFRYFDANRQYIMFFYDKSDSDIKFMFLPVLLNE